MEVKKSRKADLEGKRSLFLEIGLCASLLALIVVFASGGSDKGGMAIVAPVEQPVHVDMIAPTEHPEPRPMVAAPTMASIRVALPDRIDIVDEPRVLDTRVAFDAPGVDLFEPGSVVDVPVAGFGDDVFEVVSDMPRFLGGTVDDFARWVGARVNYPEIARSMNIQGVVCVRFVVGLDGTLGNFEIVSKTDRSLDSEVLRVVRQSPRWMPGSQAGVPAKVRVTISIAFDLR